MEIDLRGVELSEMQQRIIDSLREGKTSIEIAKELKTSRKNINNQVTTLREKGAKIPDLRTMEGQRAEYKTEQKTPKVSQLDASFLQSMASDDFVIILGKGKELLIDIVSKITNR